MRYVEEGRYAEIYGFRPGRDILTFCFTHKKTLNVASVELEVMVEAPSTDG